MVLRNQALMCQVSGVAEGTSKNPHLPPETAPANATVTR